MMHRIIRDHLEQILAEAASAPEDPARIHLAECESCRDAVDAMRDQAIALRRLRTPAAELEPRPGFYARVLERIEAQTPRSVYELFFDTMFARRIALASLALALLLGVYVVSSEQIAEPQMANVDVPRATLVSGQASSIPQDLPDMFSDSVFSDSAYPRLVTSAPDQDAVLVNLVTYREQ
jgi:predicted anti-sigma-YlaC factor YlaD